MSTSFRAIQFHTRWPLKQVGPNSFDIQVPDGGEPILNPKLVESLRLSDREIEDAEYEAIRALAVIR